MESIFNSRKVKFNDIASSEDFNDMNEELAADITNLFQYLATTDQKLTDIVETLQINNQQLTNRFKYLEKQVNNLDVDKEYIDFYRSDLLSYGEEINHENIEEDKKAYINNDYNVATLNPIYQDSKTFLYNKEDDEIFLPDDLLVDIRPKEYVGATLYDNEVLKGFDQDISTQWKRKVIYPSNSTIDSVNAQIEVTLPKSIINNMYVNTIYINPYPDASIDITDVEYQLVNSNDYFSFSGEGVFSREDNANSVMISFEDKPISKIRINLKQRNAIDIDSGSNKMFILGLQNVGIYYTDYVDTSSFYAIFEPGVRVNRIADITPLIDNTINDMAVTFEIFAEDLSTNTLMPVNLGEFISTNYNEKFWIKMTINKISGVATPVLKGLTIDVDLYGSIVGIVVDSNTDGPVNNAELTLHLDDGTTMVTKSNADGGFSFNNVKPGNYNLSATHADYLTSWYNVDVNVNRTTEMTLIVNTNE